MVCGQAGGGLVSVGGLVGGRREGIVGGSFEGTAEIEYSIDKNVYIPSKNTEAIYGGISPTV